MEDNDLLEQFKTNAVLFDSPGEQQGVMVALYPSPLVAQQLAAMPGATIPADQLHLTLAYLGRVDDIADAQIAHALLTVRRIAENRSALVGTVQGVGRFNATSSSDGKDVIFAIPDVLGLVELRNELAAVLQDRGVPVSNTHGFNPHLTLSYVEPGSESPIATIPTTALRLTALSLVVGDKRLDFPFAEQGIRFNAEEAPVTEAPVETPAAVALGDVTESGMVQFATNAQITVKEITHKGRKYLVAPSVPVREGVLNGEFVPATEIEKFAMAWNGRPMPLGHPKDAAGFISANSPDLWDETPAFFWNAHAEAGALKGEVWLDIEKAEALGGLAVQALARLRQNLPVELSTAYFRDLDPAPGVYEGKPYRGVARNLRPDHIAILLDEPGACSWQDGCGTPRVNSAQQQAKASHSFLSALVRNLISSLVPGGSKVDRNALIAGLVANKACKCSEEQLATLDDGTLQALTDTLAKPAVNTETPVEKPAPAAPAVQVVPAPVPAEVVAFTSFVEKFGGLDKLTATLDGLAANADRERVELVNALTVNERCPLGKEDLAKLSVESLRKLQSTVAPRTYAGNAGAIVSNAGADEYEELAMPTLPKSKEAK